MSKKVTDPRILRTRKLLRDALMSLLHEQRFDTITVQQIADRATINRATFYLHYADKHDLLTQAMQDILDELTLLPNPFSFSNPQQMEPQRLQAFFVEIFRHVAEHAAFYDIMLTDGSLATFAVKIQEYVEQFGIKWLARTMRDTAVRLSPEMQEIIISAVAGAYMGMIRWWLKAGMPHPPEYMAEQFMQLILPGILTTLNISQ